MLGGAPTESAGAIDVSHLVEGPNQVRVAHLEVLFQVSPVREIEIRNDGKRNSKHQRINQNKCIHDFITLPASQSQVLDTQYITRAGAPYEQMGPREKTPQRAVFHFAI